MKLPVQTIKFACTITWLLTSLISTQPILLAISAPPKPPKTGTPKGNPTPGGTRPESTCKETNKPLTALIANNGSDYTLLEYPTFWFYVPYTSQEIRNIKFLLLDEKERKTIYRTSIKLTEKSGIIKITIPSELKYALKVNELYRWRLNLDCEPDKTIEPDQVVKGWIQRVPMTSQLENQLKAVQAQEYLVYKKNGIWYDAITHLAKLHFANPENRELNDAWIKLLESLDKDKKELAQEPLVNSVLLQLED